MKNDFYTIEPDGYGTFSVFGWGTYERSSVLAGQQRKTMVDDFDTVAEAVNAYPKADVMDGRVAPAPVSVMHLPDREMNAYEEEAYFHGNDY
tara:strand:+ start:120 stop:395 length:276 start_codon:yes stop_codon:yes gene_type:complete